MHTPMSINHINFREVDAEVGATSDPTIAIVAGSNAVPAQSPTQYQQRSPTHAQPPPQQQQQTATTPTRSSGGPTGGFTVRALYDYSAADTDEVGVVSRAFFKFPFTLFSINGAGAGSPPINPPCLAVKPSLECKRATTYRRIA